MPHIPDPKFAALEMPWARAMQAQVEAIQADLDRRAQNDLNVNQGQSEIIRHVGDNIVQVDQKLTAAVNALTLGGIPGNIDQSRVLNTWTKGVSTTADVAAANGNFANGVSSVGAYNLDVSTLPGLRRTSWIHNSGAMGYAPSTRAKKANIRPYDKPASAFLSCQPKMFEYIAQIDIRDNPENASYDPTYVVPTDVGELAEDLLDADLDEFVFYEEDGTTVAGIDYISFCAVGMLVIGINHEARIAALEYAAKA